MSGLPFDPAQTGPVDVYQGAKAWLHEYMRLLLVGAVVLAVASPGSSDAVIAPEPASGVNAHQAVTV